MIALRNGEWTEKMLALATMGSFDYGDPFMYGDPFNALIEILKT